MVQEHVRVDPGQAPTVGLACPGPERAVGVPPANVISPFASPPPAPSAAWAAPKPCPVLVRFLETPPSVEVAEALVEAADDDAIVLLGRKARASPDLAPRIIEALESRDDPLAARVAEGLRRETPRFSGPSNGIDPSRKLVCINFGGPAPITLAGQVIMLTGRWQ
jgi:hypothetical protein